MAYGVKFKLEFSDHRGNARRVEILQKDYAGEQFDLVGQSDPVVIKWDGDDDFYNPIIGSSCELNLFETATTNYDPFYRAGEREYKVRISTGAEDDKIWNTENDQWEQANYKWDEEKNYEIYWEGWLQADQYKETLQPFPNAVTLVAYDGLGTLDAFNSPHSTTSTGDFDSNEDTMFFYIHSILKNINLDLDIYTSNGIRSTTGGGNDSTYHDIVLSEFALFDDLNFRDSKEVLEYLLRATNSRVFQSQGRWYIISNSNLIDENISQQFNFNIALSIKNQLINTGEEIIEYKVYDSDGVYRFTTSENVLLKAPTQLKPLNADLYKEYLRPYNAVKYKTELNDQKILNPNPQFLYDDHGWTLQNNATLETTEYSLVGSKAVRLAGHSINVDYPSVVLKNDINQVVTDETKALKIGFSFFVEPYEGLTNINDEWKYFFKILVRGINAEDDEIYYNFEENAWETTGATQVAKYNKKLVFENVNSWQDAEFNLEPKGGVEGDLKIEVNIRQISFTTYPDPLQSLIKYTYIDKVFISEVDSFAKELIATNTQVSNKTKTAVYEMEDTIISNYMANTSFQGGYTGFFRRKRTFGIQGVDFPTIEQHVTQEILNDFRDFVSRYEGTFYNLVDEPIPVSLHNKVWIDFGSGTFREGASCYIDSMTYNVKRNEYEMTMHVPNQGTDVTSNFTVKFNK